jgi:N-acetylglucosaminyldiphosphoundecaprenol N-acetyl-beta-D-mannosaminyltransferase
MPQAEKSTFHSAVYDASLSPVSCALKQKLHLLKTMLSESIPRANILGVGVSAINMAQALETIDGWISQRHQEYVCVRDVHGIMESQRDEQLKQIHNRAGLVTPDGMPLVWLSRLKGFAQVERVYGPDLMLAICRPSLAKRYRHYFYGGDKGVAEKLINRLTQQFPGLRVAGFWSPPFTPLTPDQDDEIIMKINATEPDIVWVGLSTPKQEYWMSQHLGRVTAPVMIGVGAAFDFHAGVKKQAPYWMQRNGLEWLFRLKSEPRRLWRRYLINIPVFLWMVLLEAIGKRSPMQDS